MTDNRPHTSVRISAEDAASLRDLARALGITREYPRGSRIGDLSALLRRLARGYRQYPQVLAQAVYQSITDPTERHPHVWTQRCEMVPDVKPGEEERQ